MYASLRQGQLITPFGTGAMHVSSEGISFITAGLDYWFSLADNENLIQAEFKIEEPRLQRILNVDYFYLPPDFRIKESREEHPINKQITIPLFRFPSNYFCQKCNRILAFEPVQREKPVCPDCPKSHVVPVPLVAICDHGHAQEFPWSQWVHRNPAPTCEGKRLTFQETGIPGLGGLLVVCKDCNMKRSLSGVTSASDAENTVLSDTLSSGGERYFCVGNKPWLHYSRDAACNRPLRASLRSAGNLYFSVIKSAIHIPSFGIPKKLQHLFASGSNLASVLDFAENVSIEKLKTRFHELNEFTHEDIQKAIDAYRSEKQKIDEASLSKTKISEVQQALRLEEYGVLSKDCNAEDLEVRAFNSQKYGHGISTYFDKICLVTRLRETRALAGFTRVFPDTDQTTEELYQLMWNNPPPRGRRWLPANIIYGEGIFFLLNKSKLTEWENLPSVIARAESLKRNYAKARQARNLPPKDELSARFILLHTLAHVLINQFTYDAGYSTASLRERLYISAGDDGMHGILIYTAAGDSDGTMGGLVQLGEPGYLEKTVQQAIEQASWCSADPICMEMGTHGQGPDNCNLAACHNCSLVPETACEEFNRFLDRGLLVGDEANEKLGYFNAKSV